jgi:hypothetical protein
MNKCTSRLVRELAEYKRVINHLNNKTDNFVPVKVETTDNFVFTIINDEYTTPKNIKMNCKNI